MALRGACCGLYVIHMTRRSHRLGSKGKCDIIRNFLFLFSPRTSLFLSQRETKKDQSQIIRESFLVRKKKEKKRNHIRRICGFIKKVWICVPNFISILDIIISIYYCKLEFFKMQIVGILQIRIF